MQEEAQINVEVKKQREAAVQAKEESELMQKFKKDLQEEKLDKQYLKDTKTYMGETLKI